MDGGFERLFGLDAQLLFDIIVEFILLMILYICISRLFFKPVRQYLQNRQAKIAADQEAADQDNEEAARLRAIYEEKRKEAQKEAEGYLVQSRKDVLDRKRMILDQAVKESSAIMSKAEMEVCQEKAAARDEVKKQIIDVASMMAEPYVDVPKPEHQIELLEETLKEMEKNIWQD